MAFVWKFKECFFCPECFRIFAFRSGPCDILERTPERHAFHVKSLFDKSASIDAFLVVLVIFFYRALRFWSLRLRRFRFRKLVLRPVGLHAKRQCCQDG